MAQVVIMMGSKSDEEKVSPCVDVLRSLGISYLFTVSSAHRTPERTEKILREQEAAGAKVFICAAGMAAHLAGAVAARTTRPVIGIPVSGGLMGGMDAMLATVQMPPGFPVATVAMDKAGARNAAWLAAQILAVADPALDEKIRAARAKKAEEGRYAFAYIGKILRALHGRGLVNVFLPEYFTNVFAHFCGKGGIAYGTRRFVYFQRVFAAPCRNVAICNFRHTFKQIIIYIRIKRPY